jgi:hypothetical protein
MRDIHRAVAVAADAPARRHADGCLAVGGGLLLERHRPLGRPAAGHRDAAELARHAREGAGDVRGPIEEDHHAAPAAVVELHDRGAAHRGALQTRVEEGHDAAVGRIADGARDYWRAVEVAAEGTQHAAQDRGGGAGLATEGASEDPATGGAVDGDEARGRSTLRQRCRAHGGRGQDDPYHEHGDEEAFAGHARSGSAILGRHSR